MRPAPADIVIFGQTNMKVRLSAGTSVLGGVSQLVAKVGAVGHATFGHTAIAAHYNRRKHDRVVLFTDDQMHDAGSVDLSHVPLIYTVDLAGYRPRSLPSGSRGRYTLAGWDRDAVLPTGRASACLEQRTPGLQPDDAVDREAARLLVGKHGGEGHWSEHAVVLAGFEP